MNTRTTFLIFLVAAGLAAYVFFVERTRPGTGDAGRRAPIKLPVDEARIITFTGAGGSVSFQQKDGRWFLAQPIQDRADRQVCERILSILSNLTVREIIRESEIESGEVSLSDLGLSPEEALKLTVYGPGGRSASLLVGKEAALAGTTYVSLPDDPQRRHVYLVEGNLRQIADSPLTLLRDPKVIPLEAHQVGGLLIKSEESELELLRDSEDLSWRISKPIQSRADDESVNRLVTELSELRVESVIEEGEEGTPPATGTSQQHVISLRPLPPRPPLPGDSDSTAPSRTTPASAPSPIDLTVTAYTSTDGAETPPLVTGRVSDRNVLLQLPESILQLVETNPTALRDPRLQRFTAGAVRHIFIRSRGNPDIVLSDAGHRWVSLRHDAEEPANEGRIARFLKALSDERALDFVADTSANLEQYGLADPEYRIALATSTQRPASDAEEWEPSDEIHILHFGRVARREENKDVIAESLYAQIVGEPFVVSVDPVFLANIPTHPLKWKDTGVLSFSIISLREIRIRFPRPQDTVAGGPGALARPDTRLTYDYLKNEWSLLENESDISERLDPKIAHRLAAALGSLEARDWIVARRQAYHALESPSAIINILLEMPGESADTSLRKTTTLTLAPAIDIAPGDAPFHYARIDDSPEVFLLDAKTSKVLLAPLVK